ncbi:hypothetical protein GLOIN_2v1483055 [Rhizophagus irregularis DAOM 181602=DAOM 197198]|nr:hypothetical protein GLOIN_2v1483055 [Rhizophagus irregularis DAOM 181602=DAOM 197198]
MWPKYEEYEKGLEEWLGERHPNYLQEVNYREWNNCFSGRHHSSLMQKVKDLRGFNVTVSSIPDDNEAFNKCAKELLNKDGIFTIIDAKKLLEEEMPKIAKKRKINEEVEEEDIQFDVLIKISKLLLRSKNCMNIY